MRGVFLPKIDFLGKGDVAGHHLAVPFHQLKADSKKSLGKADIDGNLILHGDNLLALKSLLPRYAGRVKCIYIDPPYNTGNENWVYNDKVNSPLIKDWNKKVVDREDQCRHDKWLCMMWPRLQLLRELLADDGVIFISIDDNEQHRLRAIMDEIFGEENFLALITWQGMDTIKNDVRYFSSNCEFILCYAKNIELSEIKGFRRTENQKQVYKNRDRDPRGPYLLTPLHAKSGTENNRYEFQFPNGQIWSPPKGTYPRFSQEKLRQLLEDGRIWLDPEGNKIPQRKTYLCEVSERVCPHTFWSYENFGSTRQANVELGKILGRGEFNNPKPVKLIRSIIDLVAKKNSIILDSFAGSGTTAHAVLALNKEDGGNRKFILVECEDYADKITAERVRRVIKGIPQAKDENLKKGLGGSFTFATLSDEIDPEKILSGETMPSWEALARHVFWLATGTTLNKYPKSNKAGLIGKYKNDHIYLLYEPNIKFMQSDDAIITGKVVDELGAKRKKGDRMIYYAAGAYVSQKDMQKSGIMFCQLPWAITKKIGGSE